MPDSEQDMLKREAAQAAKGAMQQTSFMVGKCMTLAENAMMTGNYIKAAIAVDVARKELKLAYDALGACGLVFQCDMNTDDMRLLTDAAKESLIEELQ